MKGHSVEQRVQIIKFYYQNQCSVRETFRALCNFYPRHNHPAESTIRCLIAKFESIGLIISQHQYVAETQDLLKILLLCVRVYGKTRGGSISRRSQELGLPATSTWRILRRNLGSAPL